MTPEEKAKELVNMYYNHAKSQREAIAMADNVLLTRLCQDIDDLASKAENGADDYPVILSRIKQLKYWQEVAYHVAEIKNRLPV